jgi:hypothetical protein
VRLEAAARGAWSPCYCLGRSWQRWIECDTSLGITWLYISQNPSRDTPVAFGELSLEISNLYLKDTRQLFRWHTLPVDRLQVSLVSLSSGLEVQEITR